MPGVMESRIIIGQNTIALIARVHPDFAFNKSDNATVQGLIREAVSSEKLLGAVGGSSRGSGSGSGSSSSSSSGGALGNDYSINLYDALAEDIVYQPHISVRVQTAAGNYAMEKMYKGLIDLTKKSILSLLNSTLMFLKTCRETELAKRQEMKEIKRQAEYFDNMITLTEGPAGTAGLASGGSGGGEKEERGNGSMLDRTSAAVPRLGLQETNIHTDAHTHMDMDVELTETRSSNCFICAEDVFMLGVTPW